MFARPTSRLGRFPKLPEIYLDESYYKVNHVAGSTWLLKNSPRYIPSGKGQRYCIVGAGAVLVKKGKLHAEWVPDSLKFWPSHYKADDSDYHGNFNGYLFIKWFERLCAVLELRYESCRIHVDDGSYHKVQTNAAPPSNALRADIIEWLRRQGYTAPAHYTRKQLRAVIAQVRPTPINEAVVMARKYHHEVLYTPPYHPELQPIDMIWGALKNRIALDPADTLDDLGDKFGEGLAAITKQEWIGAYKKVQSQETAYIEEAQAAAPASIPSPTRGELMALALERMNAASDDSIDVEYNVAF
ncbi:hypothetical protein PF003_g3359 [Phytophthora fragariae]|nr:hypothetical protein PF003_g3359 [Phytophthora fragariae]